jgi:hypothetical protein
MRRGGELGIHTVRCCEAASIFYIMFYTPDRALEGFMAHYASLTTRLRLRGLAKWRTEP